MGFMFPRLCHYYFMKADIKKLYLRWKWLAGSVPSQNVPCKTTTLKQERKVPVKQQITVKPIPIRTHKTSRSVTSPLALPLLNYEEPIKKDVGTQTNNTLFELFDYDYSLYHTDYSKNIIILESKIQEYLRIQELYKERCFLKTAAQELKSKRFSLGEDNLIFCCTAWLTQFFGKSQ